MQRRTCIFTGQVQGVGFRATVQRLAHRHPLSGYVRNRADGSVEMVVEGESALIDRLVRDITERMSGYIDDVTDHAEAATGEFAGFGIRH